MHIYKNKLNISKMEYSEGDCPIATWGYSGSKWMNVPPKSIVVALVAVAGTRCYCNKWIKI